MILLLGTGCLLVGSVVDIYFFTDSFITAVIYVTSRNQPEGEFVKIGKS